MTASNKALFAQLPVPIGAILTTAGTEDGLTSSVILEGGSSGGCIKRLVATTEGSAQSSAITIGIYIEDTTGKIIRRMSIELPARQAGSKAVSALQPEATADNPIEVPPGSKVRASYLAPPAGIAVHVAGDAYTYSKAVAA